jgi:hypothetical protein
VAEAYAADRPVDLAIYGSDTDQHSSKYLTSSETGDWNVAGRPTLHVRWGAPASALEKTASPSAVSYGEEIAYTLVAVGDGQALTLTDQLPDGVSPPLSHTPGLVYTPHRLTWTGTPALEERVTLTYVVSTTIPSGTIPWPSAALWNRAILTSTNGWTSTAAVLVLVNPGRVYLPLVLRE